MSNPFSFTGEVREAIVSQETQTHEYLRAFPVYPACLPVAKITKHGLFISETSKPPAKHNSHSTFIYNYLVFEVGP